MAAEQQWWRYAVLRGEGLPAELDGRWYDVPSTQGDHIVVPFGTSECVTLHATNRWEQRDDGAVAVVYEWFGR